MQQTNPYDQSMEELTNSTNINWKPLPVSIPINSKATPKFNVSIHDHPCGIVISGPSLNISE